MKKLLILLTIITLSGIVVMGQQKVSELPTISVTGTAEINVVPDEVTFTAKVIKIAKTLAEAKRLNDEGVSKLLTTARKYVADQKDIKTDYVSIAEHFERKKINADDDEYSSVFAGYRVSRTILIKLRDVAKFEAALTDLVNVGVSNISSVSFGTSKLRQYKDEARANAIAAAKEKATALAGRIGQSIGKAVSIEEKDIDGYRSPYANISSNSFVVDGADIDSDTEAIGTISVKAQVEVEFILN